MVKERPESNNQQDNSITLDSVFGEIRGLLDKNVNQKIIIKYLLRKDVFNLFKSDPKRFKDKLTPYILSQFMRDKVKKSLGDKSETLTFDYIQKTAKEKGPEVYDLVGIFIDSLKIFNEEFEEFEPFEEFEEFEKFIKVLNRGKIPNLRNLYLAYNFIGDKGVKALTESPHLGSIETLDLTENHITIEGARALAQSPNLRSLMTLSLGSNLLGPKGVKALAESPNLGSLKTLDLSRNHLGDEGVKVIIDSVNLESLETIYLSNNSLSQDMKDRLLSHFKNLGVNCRV